jgi:hypothetical protein
LVLDVDGHALTWSALLLSDDSARMLATQSYRPLGRGAWLGRLLDGVANRCVRLSRRDPREGADAEQYLYEQLQQLVVQPPAAGQPAEVVLQSAQWYQRLAVSAGELAAYCAPLSSQAVAGLKSLLGATAGHGPVGTVLVSAAASGLPGLVAAVQAVLQPPSAETPVNEEDFGEGLLGEETAAGTLRVLPADAAARGAHELAARVQRGEVRPGPQEAVPLPPARRTAPPRLHTSAQEPGRSRTRLPFPAGEAAPHPARRRSHPAEE